MGTNLEPIPVTSQKHDPAWKHCQMFKNGDKVELKCIYCGKSFRGGGIHRIKEHLAGQKGNAATCLRVLPDVRLLMQQSLEGAVVKKRKKQRNSEEIAGINPPPSEADHFRSRGVLSSEPQAIGDSAGQEQNLSLVVQEEGRSNKRVEKKKRGRPRNSTSVAPDNPMPISFSPNPVCTVGSGLQRAKGHAHMAIARFFYDVGLPLDAVNSVYFQPMVSAIFTEGSALVAPSYHDLRGWILKNVFEEVKNETNKYMGAWGRTGCSILVDELKTEKGLTILNILVYCPEGTMFLRSIDASHMLHSTTALYELLKDIIEEVGIENVLQVITNCEEHYRLAGRRLTDTFPTVYWTPCATQSLNLMFEDFSKVEWINAVLEQAKCITRFVYNHSFVLNMMRRFTSGNDLVVPESTSYATNFMTLKRMVDLKHNLQGMVTSEEWMNCPYSKRPEGLAMLDYISNQSFWSSCILITRLTEPLLRVLRMVRSERRPAMGYVYAGIYRAKEAIKKEHAKRKDYLTYWNIIDHSWGELQSFPLHAAGFYLNPKFFYSIEGDIHNNVVSGLFDCIERLVPDTKIQDKIMKEISSYKNSAGDFGRKMAIRARDTLLPAEWWSTYGGSCPNLARLAVRILSQSCSSSGYQQNQIAFEQIHRARNSLEHQRLSDLAFVQYNLRLKQMLQKNPEQDPLDPISFDSINVVDDWVTVKEMCLEVYGSADWMMVDPTLANTRLLGSSNDETEGLGFDDSEIFDGRKDDGEDNDENHMAVC